MKYFRIAFLFLCFVLCFSVLASAKSKPVSETSTTKTIPKSTKGAKVVPGAFQIKMVIFSTIVLNNQPHLAATVFFNRNVDASTVQQNVNIRMLKKNENHFWLDASTQNNIVKIRPNFITWLSGAPLKNGLYKMYLRGTIKSADGVSLDCNGDGKGEGGYLPAYESQLYQSNIIELEELEEKH